MQVDIVMGRRLMTLSSSKNWQAKEFHQWLQHRTKFQEWQTSAFLAGNILRMVPTCRGCPSDIQWAVPTKLEMHQMIFEAFLFSSPFHRKQVKNIGEQGCLKYHLRIKVYRRMSLQGLSTLLHCYIPSICIYSASASEGLL